MNPAQFLTHQSLLSDDTTPIVAAHVISGGVGQGSFGSLRDVPCSLFCCRVYDITRREHLEV
jgi:hypothetical protein